MAEDVVEYDPKGERGAPDGPPVDFGLGYYLPAAITARYTGKDLPCEVEIRAVLEDGRFAVEYVKARRRHKNESVTLEDLRDIPVASLVAKAALTLLHRYDSPHPAMRLTHRGLKNIAADIVPMLAKNITEGEELQHVAVIYRIAHACGYGPTRAVAEALDVSRATAGRWIADARSEGLLGPAIERRPGERKPRRKGK